MFCELVVLLVVAGVDELHRQAGGRFIEMHGGVGWDGVCVHRKVYGSVLCE